MNVNNLLRVTQLRKSGTAGSQAGIIITLYHPVMLYMANMK